MSSSEIENENSAETHPKFNDFRSFGILAFLNAFQYHNFDFSTLISNHFCTSCKIQISDSRVYGERSCTAGVDNCYHG